MNKKEDKQYVLSEGFEKKGGLGKKPIGKRPPPPKAHRPKSENN